MNRTIKSIIKNALSKAGLEVRRKQSGKKDRVKVFDNPHEALLCDSNLVDVKVDLCVDKLGFNYGGWQPWKATVEQLIANPEEKQFQSSVFYQFYKKWHFPLISSVFSDKIYEEKFRNHFLKVFHGVFMPFCDSFESDINSQVVSATTYIESDNANAGHALTIGQSINPDGTWTILKGDIELIRLSRLIDSIQQHGYQRTS